MRVNLDPFDINILQLVFVEGWSIRRAAEQVGVSTASVRTLLRHPLVKDLIDEVRQELVEDMRNLEARVVRKLAQHIDSDDPKVSLDGIDKWFKTQGRYKTVDEIRLTAEDVVKNLLDARNKSAENQESQVVH